MKIRQPVLCLLPAVLALFPLSVSALNTEVAPPSKPYMEKPPSGSTWTATWVYPEVARKSGTTSGPAPDGQNGATETGATETQESTPPDAGSAGSQKQNRPRRVEAIQMIYTTAMTQLKIQWSRGRPSDVYISADRMMFVSEDNKKAYLGSSDQGSAYETTGLFVTGFHGTDWVNSMGKFLGEEEINGRPCRVFSLQGSAPASLNGSNKGDSDFTRPSGLAWIDKETRYPVRVELEGLYAIDFSSVLPTDFKPQLPNAARELLEKKRARERALEEMKKYSK